MKKRLGGGGGFIQTPTIGGRSLEYIVPKATLNHLNQKTIPSAGGTAIGIYRNILIFLIEFSIRSPHSESKIILSRVCVVRVIFIIRGTC